nr:DoxX family membrane protein [uncultured Chitinophaga sp.]
MATVKQVRETLRLTYGIVPIVAGLDKFTHLLTDWTAYLTSARSMIPFEPATFMKMVGVIEIVAGVLVLLRPLWGAWVVMIWLLCIAVQLLAGGSYFDVAVRDIVMAIGAWSLAQLYRTENKP